MEESSKGLAHPSHLCAFAMDFFGLLSDAVYIPTADVDTGRTHELFEGNTTCVGAKRLRLRGSVSLAKVHI